MEKRRAPKSKPDLDESDSASSASTPSPPVGYLEGYLLIATPLITESCFAHAVIYICAHNQGGAMGLVINHTIQNLAYGDIFTQLNIDGDRFDRETPVFFGGPVDAARGFVLHSCEYGRTETVLMQNGISLTSNIQVLRDMAVGMGPKKALLALGYAGWTAGQLEAEIEANSWLTVPATPDLVFDTANDLKWNHSALSVGVDISKLSGQAGHA